MHIPRLHLRITFHLGQGIGIVSSSRKWTGTQGHKSQRLNKTFLTTVHRQFGQRNGRREGVIMKEWKSFFPATLFKFFMYTKPAPRREVPHSLQPSGYIPQLINPLFFISWCNLPAKLKSVCFMGTKRCHPAHNWSTQQSTELFIICINIIDKGKGFDLAVTNLILLGLCCFQHFFLLKKFPRNFAPSSWVRRQGSLSVRNSHRNKILCYDQVRLFSIIHSFIFISFKSSAASTEKKVLPATAVNPLTLV